MFKKAAQRGRSEQGTEAYVFRYVEVPSDARTKLEAFFNILQRRSPPWKKLVPMKQRNQT
jgi:hypothetical protein